MRHRKFSAEMLRIAEASLLLIFLLQAGLSSRFLVLPPSINATERSGEHQCRAAGSSGVST